MNTELIVGSVLTLGTAITAAPGLLRAYFDNKCMVKENLLQVLQAEKISHTLSPGETIELGKVTTRIKKDDLRTVDTNLKVMSADGFSIGENIIVSTKRSAESLLERFERSSAIFARHARFERVKAHRKEVRKKLYPVGWQFII